MHDISRSLIAKVFSISFLLIAVLLAGLAVHDLAALAIDPDTDMMTAVIKAINALVISLAMFELGMGVAREYAPGDSGDGSDDEDIFSSVRKAITRFVGTVCIALVLESLIMIIKYSQLELAGNLFYPVGILVATSLLLLALGGFLRLSQQPAVTASRAPAAASSAVNPGNLHQPRWAR